MYEPVQTCKHCGANLTLDDLRGTNCKYCGTVLPHHAQAAQHAQMAAMVMNQMIGQQAQIQAQWRGGAPGSPYASPLAVAEAHRAMSQGLARTITIVVVACVIGALVLTGAIVALVMLR